MSKQEISRNAFGSITQEALSESQQKLIISHATCKASISLYGGHVLSWQPKGQAPVFWLSNTAKFQEGTAIRGGIPLCWPWFGAHSDGVITANHGFARQSTWQLVDAQINEDAVEVTLEFSGQNEHVLWPAPFSVRQTLSFGQRFEQRLAMTNLDEKAIDYTAAIHSYFQVSNPKNCSVPVLSPATFDDKIEQTLQVTKPLADCVGPLDRIYYQEGQATLIDTGFRREIAITPINTKQWVLWNPGADIAKTMADVHENGEQEYVCLEAANTQWQTLPPNESIVIGQIVEVNAID